MLRPALSPPARCQRGKYPSSFAGGYVERNATALGPGAGFPAIAKPSLQPAGAGVRNGQFARDVLAEADTGHDSALEGKQSRRGGQRKVESAKDEADRDPAAEDQDRSALSLAEQDQRDRSQRDQHDEAPGE